jgi:uncharacterized protein YaaN involved in tellurite resistance
LRYKITINKTTGPGIENVFLDNFKLYVKIQTFQIISKSLLKESLIDELE